MGGSGAIIDALVRGLRKFGGRLELRAHVEEVLVEGTGDRQRAAGVRLRDGSVIKAKTVISNATLWDTAPLLPPGCVGRGRSGLLRPPTRALTHQPLLPQPSQPPLLNLARVPACPPPSGRFSALPKEWLQSQLGTKQCESFVHLHLGIDGAWPEG